MLGARVPAGTFKRTAAEALDNAVRHRDGGVRGVRQRELLEEAKNMESAPGDGLRERAERVNAALHEEHGEHIGENVLLHWLRHPMDCILVLNLAVHEIIALAELVRGVLLEHRDSRRAEGYSTAARVCIWVNRLASAGTYANTLTWHRGFFMEGQISHGWIEEDTDIISRAVFLALSEYVKFPEGPDLEALRRSFGEEHPVQDVGWCVDCSHLSVCIPGDSVGQKAYYAPHKQLHSVKVLVVTDWRGCPLHVDCHGMMTREGLLALKNPLRDEIERLESRPGSMPDATHFDVSELADLVRRNKATGVRGLGGRSFAQRQCVRPTNRREDKKLRAGGLDMDIVAKANSRIAQGRAVFEGYFAAHEECFPAFWVRRLESRGE